MILKSGKHCLTGVDNNWFWIFLKTGPGYHRVLTGGTISLGVLNSKTRGLRDIETGAATAQTNYTNIYKFDGVRYKARICLETKFYPEGQKPNRVPCRTR